MDPQSQIQNPEQVSEPPAPVPSTAQVLPAQLPKSNTLLILIGLILIILSGVGGFYLGSYVFPQEPSLTPTLVSSPVSSPTRTPDPTANWKIYEDFLGGYSVKYPEEFKLSDYKEGDYMGISLNFNGSKQERIEASLIDGILVRTLVITSSEPAKDLAERGRSVNSQPQPLYSNPVVSELRESILSGKPGYTYTITDSVSSTEVKVFYVQREKSTINVWYILVFSSETKTEYLSKADQILSTFKFTE